MKTTTLTPKTDTEGLMQHVAVRDLRHRVMPADGPVYARACAIDFSAGIARDDRICRVRLRIGELKRRVAWIGFVQACVLHSECRGPGFTWRGWWYPAWLVGALLGVAFVVAGAWLAVGIFRHPWGL